MFLLPQTLWSSFYVIFYAKPVAGKPSLSCWHLTCCLFLAHLQAHCLCVQVICTSQTLHLHWWQCPVSNFDLAGKQAEVRRLLWKCWFTFQQCFEGNQDKYSPKLPVLSSGLIWIISARHKLITTPLLFLVLFSCVFQQGMILMSAIDDEVETSRTFRVRNLGFYFPPLHYVCSATGYNLLYCICAKAKKMREIILALSWVNLIFLVPMHRGRQKLLWIPNLTSIWTMN